MPVTWRLTVGEVDEEPAVLLLHQDDRSWQIKGVVRLETGAEGKIERIADYQHCPWLLTAGSIVVQEVDARRR